ncbi:hypothetical protein [Allonocardiopsis opalescens]|uniref:hypothetical protein n=1 Tax=Allonocardiopsis opalescens TaxID=1144618 RepID=UPI0011B226F9|nr:hypothetical protein [Allonocardiopsis opalescens]
MDLSITLPLGIEAYAGIALYVAVSGIVTGGARFFAWCSAIGSLVIGAVGQAAYHLLSLESQPTSAPTPVVIFVSVLPVLVLGLASVLLHLAEKRDTMAVPRRAGKASHSTVPADAADRPTEASHEPRETAPETVPFDRPTPVPHTPNGTSHGTVPTIPVGRLTGPSHETLADRPTEVPQPRPTEPDETPAERPTAARAPRPTNRPKPAAGKPSSRPKTASAKRPTKTSDTPEIEIPDYVPDDWDERKQRVVARFEEARRAGIKMTLGEISRLTEVPKSTVDRYVKEWLESSPEPEATSADSTN